MQGFTRCTRELPCDPGGCGRTRDGIPSQTRFRVFLRSLDHSPLKLYNIYAN